VSQNLNSNNGCDVPTAHIGAISSANATLEKVESGPGKDEGENATLEKVESVMGKDERERRQQQLEELQNIRSVFKLINVEPVDPNSFNSPQRLLKGESSKVKGKIVWNEDGDMCMDSRLVIQSLSNSLTDSNIINCNRRFRESEIGLEELRLWGIAKEIGVVFHECEESIIRRFSEMEQSLMRGRISFNDSFNH